MNRNVQNAMTGVRAALPSGMRKLSPAARMVSAMSGMVTRSSHRRPFRSMK